MSSGFIDEFHCENDTACSKSGNLESPILAEQVLNGAAFCNIEPIIAMSCDAQGRQICMAQKSRRGL